MQDIFQDMKPERIQLVGPDGLFKVILEAVFLFATHDEAVDFSKAVGLSLKKMGQQSVSFEISRTHELTVRVKLEGEGQPELSAAEREVVERIGLLERAVSAAPLAG